MHQKTVVEKAMEYCCCATYRAVGLDEKCGICELVDAFIHLDDQRANMWRIIHTVKINSDGAMSLTESLLALVELLGETNDALAACQSEGAAWKRKAEEMGAKMEEPEITTHRSMKEKEVSRMVADHQKIIDAKAPKWRP